MRPSHGLVFRTVAVLAGIGLTPVAFGQSLADVARKEKKRRQGLAETRVLTEKDARNPGVVAAASPSPTPAPTPSPAPTPLSPRPPAVSATPDPPPVTLSPPVALPTPVPAATPPIKSAGLSLIYTGRSLGALGALRSQDEHELLTERANEKKIPFKLVSHASWRSAGVSIFLPSDEPDPDDLPKLLKLRPTAEPLGEVATLVSGNAVLLQDPAQPADTPDLLAMLRENPRAATAFPDLRPGRAAVYRANMTKKKVAYFVEEEGATFLPDPAMWEEGEMNRIDISGARVFELPLNLAQIGPRATLIRGFAAEAEARGSVPLLVDLGSQNGDLGVEEIERARIDMGVLQRLGYELVVPFEFELGLGAATLKDLKGQFSGLAFLASNVKAKTPGLLEETRVVSAGGARFGLIGLVNPGVRSGLPRRALGDWTFEDPVLAATREIEALRLIGVDVIIALSNLSPQQNADLSRRVAGLDAIVADLHTRWSPEGLRMRVDLPDRPYSRPGSPALVARGFANGLGVGRVEAQIAPDDRPGLHLATLRHDLASVTDRVASDRELASEVRNLLAASRGKRGAMLVPSFVELESALPGLRTYDATTAQGRISKRMWEEFMARLLRRRGSAEVALIRPLSHFPPLIGKLHENEVREWLWTDEAIVTVDLRGVNLRRILDEDGDGQLVLSGLDRKTGLINGRRLDEGALYRIATTDLLFDGARFRAFEQGRRVRRTFELGPGGLAAGAGGAVALRDLVLDELRGIRGSFKGDDQIRRVATLLAPDPGFERLSTIYFDRPTIFGSLVEGFNNAAYGSVPESRATAQRSSLFGGSGRFRLVQDRRTFTTEFGMTLAYSKQSTTSISGRRSSLELTDDLRADITVRPKTAGQARRYGPFSRAIFDTEFTATVNPRTSLPNPRQAALSGVLGVMKSPGPKWRALEVGGVVETDLSRNTLLAGLTARADFQAGRSGRLNYRLKNDLTWFAYTGKPDPSVLSLRYNMVHEVLFPLFDELSLSVAADGFLFRGAAPSTHRPGFSLMLRVGLTYDRLWKPRYQPLF